MEAIVKLNQNQKKKSKQFDDFRSKILNDLKDVCEKKAVKKIKK